MTRETRLNLIFISLLVLSMIPGGIMLIKKKLQPGATSNAEPEVFLQQTAYMDPLPLPNFKRITPRLTVQWVQQITGMKMITPPLMSQERTYQVVNLYSPHSTGARDAATTQDSAIAGKLIVWNIKALEERGLLPSAASHSPDVLSYKTLDIPPNIREELRSSGFVNPPRQVMIVDFQIPASHAPPSHITMFGEACELPER